MYLRNFFLEILFSNFFPKFFFENFFPNFSSIFFFEFFLNLTKNPGKYLRRINFWKKIENKSSKKFEQNWKIIFGNKKKNIQSNSKKKYLYGLCTDCISRPGIMLWPQIFYPKNKCGLYESGGQADSNRTYESIA